MRAAIQGILRAKIQGLGFWVAGGRARIPPRRAHYGRCQKGPGKNTGTDVQNLCADPAAPHPMSVSGRAEGVFELRLDATKSTIG